MSLTKQTQNVALHQLQVDEPNDVGGLTPAQFKALCDAAAVILNNYINNTLTEEIEAQFATNEALNQIVAGHVNMVDPSNGAKYAWKVLNGQVYLEEV